MNRQFNMDRNKLWELDRTHDTPDDVIETCIHNLLVALGENPDREGLKETPSRVRRMYHEVYEGMKYTNKEIATKFDKCFEDVQTGDLVTISDITVFSYCEHHLALMYDMLVHVGYLPKGKVIGLSKVARIADMCAKRLQLQERIGMDIADVLEMVLGTDDIIVVIEGKHSCMTARGIKNSSSMTRTATLRGVFKTDSDLRNEFYKLVQK